MIKKILTDNVLLALSIFIFSIFVVLLLIRLLGVNLTYEEVTEGLIIELFGMLFDIAILVLLVSIINKRGDEIKDLNRYKEELDDYRTWYDKEAMYRVGGILRRIGKDNFSSINLSELHLGNAPDYIIEKVLTDDQVKIGSLDNATICNLSLINESLDGLIAKKSSFSNLTIVRSSMNSISLSGSLFKECTYYEVESKNGDFEETRMSLISYNDSIFINSNFGKSIITSSDINDSTFKRSTFINSKIVSTKFYNSKINDNAFDNAILISSQFINCSLEKTSFQNSSIFSVSFAGSNISECDFSGTELKNVNFNGSYTTSKFSADNLKSYFISKGLKIDYKQSKDLFIFEEEKNSPYTAPPH